MKRTQLSSPSLCARLVLTCLFALPSASLAVDKPEHVVRSRPSGNRDLIGAHDKLSIAAAGDVDGDGFSDVIVGACTDSGASPQTGRAYLFRGSSKGLLRFPSWKAEGEQESRFGTLVAPAGDVNGDRFADVIVTALGSSEDTGQPSCVYVYYGSPVGLSAMADWSAHDEAHSQFGYSASAAGDINGDGFGDLIIGAPGYQQNDARIGRALLYLGSRKGLESKPVWIARGNQHMAFFGQSVAGAGDVDADGFSDVLICAPDYRRGGIKEGHVSLFYGSQNGLSIEPNCTLEGKVGFGQFQFRSGFLCCPGGDVNADGFADIIVGNTRLAHGLPQALICVSYGSRQGLRPSFWFAELGDSRNAAPAWSVAPAGDINGDGIADLISASRGGASPSSEATKFSIRFGSTLGPIKTFEWTSSDQQFDPIRINVSSAGDVNGDGFADVILGAKRLDAKTRIPGSPIILYGSASLIAPLTSGTDIANWFIAARDSRFWQRRWYIAALSAGGVIVILLVRHYRSKFPALDAGRWKSAEWATVRDRHEAISRRNWEVIELPASPP